MKKATRLQLPAGMKDMLPGEARLKRTLESLFAAKFTNWGYQEIITPVLEYYENLLPAETPADQFFKLIDREGRILAMRTDMTTPIARMMSSKISPNQFPLRLFYVANVFRYESPQMGRQREFFQAGVELIGDSGPEADAEVIALAAESLKDAGLDGFQISIGQVNFFKGMIDRLDIDETVKEKIRGAVSRKDFVELEMLLESSRAGSKEKEMMLTFPSLRGDFSIIEKAGVFVKSDAVAGALENLREVFRLLKVYGVEKDVFIDLGIMRDFEYYSGIVFEGYCPGVGVPICGGGRYDQLLGQYGMNAPATGFAIGLERLMLALEQQRQAEKSAYIDYLVVSDDVALAVRKAQELRRQGYSVLVSKRDQEMLMITAKSIVEL